MSVYYPCLRAKTYDVIAVEQAAAAMVQSGNIEPIFEPVKVNSNTLTSRAAAFAQAGLAVGVVINPEVGELVGNIPATSQMVATMRAANAVVHPALILLAATQPGEVTGLNALAAGGAVIFIHHGEPTDPQTLAAVRSTTNAVHIFHEGHVGPVHEASFRTPPRGRLRDGFRAQIRNSDYPPRSFFSDLHTTYQPLGFHAFGDFTTTGYRYLQGGGPAYAVAIHVTEATQQGIECNHFLSVSNATQANPAGKFGEAVAALDAYAQANPGRIDFTNACQELRGLHQRGHFPGLGDLKRLSIQHHLELMSTLV